MKKVCRVAARYDFDAGRHAALDERYERYAEVVESLRAFWRAKPARAAATTQADAPVSGRSS